MSVPAEPATPEMTYRNAIQGHPYTITCSVIHSCPSAWPQLTWSRGSAKDILEIHRKLPLGLWDLTSVLTFIPQENDNHEEIDL